jgi:hypothetical protein
MPRLRFYCLQDYADPLRNFSKKKEEALLDKYKAKTLFGNIDQLLPVNEAFLNDLEKMIGPNGQKLVGGLGDICLKHVCHCPTNRRKADETSNNSFEIRAHLIATSYTTPSERKPKLSSRRSSPKEANLDFLLISRLRYHLHTKQSLIFI